jgi:ABC-2 type transport system permease protein
MFNRIKILVLLQLSNKTRLYAKNSKRLYAHIAIRTFIVAVITFVMSLLLHFIKNIIFIPVNANFLIFILIITQVLNIISSTVGLVSDLYHSKDNQILFSLAAKNDEIFLSKMIVYYLNEFIRNLYLLVPILLGYGIINELGFLYYFISVIVVCLLPLISTNIASLLAVPVTIAKNYFSRHTMFSFLLTLISIGLLFYLTYYVVGQITTPIRIIQLYNRFIISLTQFMQSMASYGTIYTVIGKLLHRLNFFLNFGILILTVFVLVIGNYMIAKPLYFNLISASQENSIKKDLRHKPRENKSLFYTFFNKEFMIARRSPNELLNNYALLLTLPFFIYILNYIYMGMNRSTFGNQLVLILNVVITLLIVTGSNTASATAITTEGFEFTLLKTAPYNTSKIAWAKVTFNLIFTFIVITISYILFSQAIPVFPKQNIWLLYLFVLIVDAGHIFWSFQIDMMSPKLSDYAATGSLSNNDNVSKSLSYGLVLSLMFGMLAVLAFVFLEDIGWYVMFAIGLAFTIYRVISFQAHLKAYFIDIEY